MRALLPILFICILGFTEIYIETPHRIIEPSDKEFSAVNAMKHIEAMGTVPHFMGTAENRKVKEYIIDYLTGLGISTEEFDGYSQLSWGSYARLAKTENIIARIPGTDPTKTLMLCAHYDSVLNAPGGADDVHAVACIMEVAKLLLRQERKNDVILLITDGEEMGLLGAKAYSEKYDVSNLGLILNYEARGNAGPNITFEWSDGNAWLVQQLKKVGIKPTASSLSYEIYKMLPNDTDYSRFKEKGVPGINHAFIDGFSYYHNPEDNAENVNVASVQHTGDNMYRLASHFVNQDLTDVRSHNASFFNMLGALIVYPSQWDIFILIGSILLFIFLFYKKNRADQIKIVHYGVSLFILLFSVFACFGLSYLLGKLIYILYPHYDVFYSGQYYNHMWYWGAMTGMCIIILWLIIGYAAKKFNTYNIQMAALTIILAISTATYFIAQTATYIFLLPAVLIILFLLLNKENDAKNKAGYFLPYLFAFIPCLLWIPVYRTFYNAFSIAGISLASVFFGIIALGLFAIFPILLSYKQKVSPFFGISLFLACMAIAHIKSKPSEEKPLPSSLFYVHNTVGNSAKWVTYDSHKNIGNQMYLSDHNMGVVPLHGSDEHIYKSTEIYNNIEVPSVSQDSSIFLIRHNDEAYLTRVLIQDMENIEEASINNQPIIKSGSDLRGKRVIDVFGMTQDSMLLNITKKDTSVNEEIYVCTRYLKLPTPDKIEKNACRVDGFSSVVQKINY